MKLLVLQTGSFSSVMLSTPLVRCVKMQVPEVEIHFLVREKHLPLVEHNVYIDHKYAAERVSLRQLKEVSFDHIIDLADNDFTKKLARALRQRPHSYRKAGFQTAIYTKLKWNVMPRKHLADRFFETVSFLNVQNDGRGLDYSVPKDHEVTERDIPASHHLGYVAIAVGASHFTKRMPVEKLQELCKMIDHPIMLIGAEREYADAEAIASFDPIKVYNACGKFYLHETADLIKRSKLLIAHDNGLAQLAAALQKPVISVWGSTTPSFGRRPYYDTHYLKLHESVQEDVQLEKLWCRPCTATGRDRCPLGHFKCMKEISVASLAKIVHAKLNELGKSKMVGLRN